MSRAGRWRAAAAVVAVLASPLAWGAGSDSLLRAEAALRDGDPEAALVGARMAFAADGGLGALLLEQSALTALCRRGEAIEAAAARLAQNPDDPAAIILSAHLVRDPRLARARLAEAVVRHPESADLALALAAAARRAGDLEAARQALGHARALAETAWAPLDELATIEASAGDDRAALRAARAALVRRPGDPRLAWRVAVFAARTDEIAVAMEAALRAARGDPRWPRARGTVTALAVREGMPRMLRAAARSLAGTGDDAALGRLAEAGGDTRGAYGHFQAIERPEPWVERRLRALALAVGDGPAAWRAFASVPGEAALLDGSNALADRFARLHALLLAGTRSWRSRDGVEALLDVGWVAEARRLARGLEVAGEADAHELVERTGRFVTALAALDALAADPDALHDVAVDALASRTASIVSALGDPVTTHVAHFGPLAAWFGPGEVVDAHGRDPLADRGLVWHAGRTPDGWTLLRAQGYVHLRAGVPGDPAAAATFWAVGRGGDEPSLDGVDEQLEGVTTLGGDTFIDLDTIARLEAQQRAPVPVSEVAWRARTPAEQAAIDEPLCVARRVLARAAREEGAVRTFVPEGLGPVFASVLEHERGHLTDHRDVQPPWRHPVRAAAIAFRGWWSGLGIGAEFERRAELRALANSPAPLTALALTLLGLSGEPWDDPHRRAYRAIVQQLVDTIERAGPASYGLDPARNLLQQLDRLSGTAVRALAEEMARDDALPLGRAPGPTAYGGLQVP